MAKRREKKAVKKLGKNLAKGFTDLYEERSRDRAFGSQDDEIFDIDVNEPSPPAGRMTYAPPPPPMLASTFPQARNRTPVEFSIHGISKSSTYPTSGSRIRSNNEKPSPRRPKRTHIASSRILEVPQAPAGAILSIPPAAQTVVAGAAKSQQSTSSFRPPDARMAGTRGLPRVSEAADVPVAPAPVVLSSTAQRVVLGAAKTQQPGSRIRPTDSHMGSNRQLPTPSRARDLMRTADQHLTPVYAEYASARSVASTSCSPCGLAASSSPNPTSRTNSSSTSIVRAPPPGHCQVLSKPLFIPSKVRVVNEDGVSPMTPTFKGFDEVCGAARYVLDEEEELDRSRFAAAVGSVDIADARISVRQSVFDPAAFAMANFGCEY